MSCPRVFQSQPRAQSQGHLGPEHYTRSTGRLLATPAPQSPPFCGDSIPWIPCLPRGQGSMTQASLRAEQRVRCALEKGQTRLPP